MKGSYNVIVYNKDIHYDFIVRRNITIIRGDSGSGKTTLFNLIRDYDNIGISSGIIVQCKKRCTVLSGANWKATLSGIHDCVVFIDEMSEFIKTTEFAEAIKNSDNYFVIITRDKLAMLPYSVEEIYGIHSSGTHNTLQGEYSGRSRVYNTFYKLYENRKMNHF